MLQKMKIMGPKKVKLQMMNTCLTVSWHSCPRGKLPPGNCPLNDCSRIIKPKIITTWQYPPWKLPPKEITFWIICYLHNCLQNCSEDKRPWGKLMPRKISPRINYTQLIFSPRIRNRITLIDSYFLLFSFFVV